MTQQVEAARGVETVPAGEWTVSFVGEARGPLMHALDGAVGCVVDAVRTDGSVVTGRLTRVWAGGVTVSTAGDGGGAEEDWSGAEEDVEVQVLERLLVW